MESNQLVPLNSLKDYSGEVPREDILRRSRHSGLVAGLNRAAPQCDDEKKYCTEAQKNPEPFQELHVPRKTPLTQQIRSDGKCTSGVFSGVERAPVRARPLNCFHSTLKNRALKPPQCCTSESHNLGKAFFGGPQQSTKDCTDHGDESSMPTCQNTSGHGNSGFQEVNRSKLTHCSLRADPRTAERAPVGAPSAQYCSANFSPSKVEKSPAKPQRNSVVVRCSDGPSRFPCGSMAGGRDSCSPLPAASVGHSLAAAHGVGSVGTISSAAVQDAQRPSAISTGGTRTGAEAPTPASPLSTEAAICAARSFWPSAQSVPSARPPGPKSSPTAIAAVSAGNGPSKRPFLRPVGITRSPRVTRRQASAAALAEVVRIEDSSDEEGPSSLINPSENPNGSPEGELENCRRIPQTTNGEMENSVNYSPSGLQEGVRADASQGTTAFILLAAALVGEDGHCCLLNPETLRRAAVEHAVVQQHQQQPCIGKNASATPTKENNRTEHALQGDGGPTNCLLVLQVRREEAVVSLDLWRPLPEPYSPSANEQKNDCSHSYGETVALPVQDRLERLLNFPQQSISFLKCLKLYAGASCPSFPNIGQRDKQEGSCRCVCSSRKIRLCLNKSSSKSSASHDAKEKDRRHARKCTTEENPQEKHFGEAFPRSRKQFVLTDDADATNVLAPDTFSSPARDGAVSAFPGESLTNTMQPAQLAAGDASATRRCPDATRTARTAAGMESTEYRGSKTSSEVSYGSCNDREVTGKAISSGTASEEHRRQTKNRTSDKRTKSANDSKENRKSRRDRGSSRREGHSRRSRSPRGEATAKTKSQLPLSSQKVSAEEKKKDGHFVTPRNALIVTDGKPFLGAELTTGDAELTRLETHKPTQDDAEVDSGKMKGDKDSRNSSSANLRVTSATCKSNSKKRRQHSSSGPVKSGGSCSLAINECKESHTTGKKAPKEHQPSKELPGAGTSASKSKCYCGHVFDCRKCHKACARCISSGAIPHVPVLYLELCSSGTRSLYCNEILQRALELDSGQASCVASSVEKEQPSAEGAHAVTCTAGVPAVLPTAHSTGTRCWSPHADGGIVGSSTSSKSGETSSISSSASSSTCRATTAYAVDCNKEDSHHRRSSRKLHEVKDCEADSWHQASSGVKHSSGLSRTKRECNSSSRRSHKCSSSQKRRRRGHSPTSEAVVDETFEKLLSCSADQSVLACSICLDCCTTGSCSNSTTKSLLGTSTVAKDTNQNKASVKLRPARATTLGAAILETSKGSLLKAEGYSIEKQTTGDLSRKPIEQLPQRKGPWLLICVGPSLQAAPAKESSSSTYEGRKGAPIEPHSAQSDMTVSYPAGSGAHGSSTDIKLLESEYASGCRGDLESLCKVILPSDVAAPPLYNLGGLESAGDPVDVENLSMFFANCITKQSGSHDHEDDAHFKGNRAQTVTELVLRISKVLHEFVLRSIGPWKAMHRSKSAIYSLSLEALVSSWRAREFRMTGHFSERGERVDRRHLHSGSAASLEASRSASCKANTTVQVFTGRAGKRLATAVTSPAFDLLLDDKTLRRLSDKEFLDDTIIDFCLGFIVNHILTPQERVRVHICNTFFLSALMGQRCEIEAHSRLTRWLKKEVTPLPRKDFIFIPVHHKHQHWSLAVVVCPWRALNPTQKSGGEKAVRSAAVNVKCKPEANRSVRDFQLSFSPGMHAQQAGVERPVSSALAEKVAPSPIVQHQAVELPTPLKTQGPHTHRGCRAKARLFYVDSMGLRSVFDRSRGRLKRFLRHEFEHRCGGEMNCGQEVELCTESCCWHDGVSCTLHTPRQQNGYDCGVFVVEYVYFLTRNLNAIETLLLGPSRDFQPQQRSSRDQTPDSTASFVPHNWFVHPGTRVEAVNHGKLLEATLGFYCHCMDVGIPKEMPRVVSSALGLASSLNVHSAEFGQMNTAMHGSAAADVSRQQELRQQAGTPQSPLNTSLAGASFVTRTLTPPPVELVCRSMIPPDAPQLHDQNGLVGDFWRAKDESTTSKLSSAQPESMRHWKAALALQGPLWGPLAPSVSKRRSAHTKWFSQDRVTERRSQLHKMLLFMRQNVLWQEDPKLVAHLKSLFLDIERPCH